MSYLPFVATSYVLAAVVLIGFSVNAWLRLGAARRRLAAIDLRREGTGR
jgi:hypothetical protein